MPTQVVRPTTALGTGIFTANGLSAKFAMKVFEYSGQHRIPLQEVTGTGDSVTGGPVYEHGDIAYSQFRLTGCMVTATALGLQNLNSQISGGSTTLSLQLDFGGANNQGTKAVVVESIQVQASMRQSAIVGVVISGRYVEDALAG